MYLISHRGLWWRTNRCGYTDNILDAGLYSEQDVKSICGGRREPPDIAFSVVSHRQEIERAVEDLARHQANGAILMEALREQGTGGPHAGLAEDTES
jgi:hypothetical protein